MKGVTGGVKRVFRENIEKWLKSPMWKRSGGTANEAPPDERDGNG